MDERDTGDDRLNAIKAHIKSLLPGVQKHIVFQGRATFKCRATTWRETIVTVTPHFVLVVTADDKAQTIFKEHCMDISEIRDDREIIWLTSAHNDIVEITFPNETQEIRFVQSFMKVYLASGGIRGRQLSLKMPDAIRQKVGLRVASFNPSQRFMYAYLSESVRYDKKFFIDLCVYYHLSLAHRKILFNFNEIPMFQATSERILAVEDVDLKPILSVLRFCNSTFGIFAENIQLKDIFTKSSVFFPAPNGMRYLILRNVGAQAGGNIMAKKLGIGQKGTGKVKSDIQFLDISGNHITDMEPFAKALVYLDSPMKGLVLERMQMDSKELRALFTSLKENTSLHGIEELAVAGNQISSKTGKKLFDFLKLKELPLRILTVGPIADVAGLVHAIISLPLEKLVITGSEIGDSASKELSKLIQKNMCLTYLGLADCSLKAKDLKRILAPLESGKDRMIGLDLARVELTKDRLTVFMDSLKNGLLSRVTDLVLDGNPLSGQEFKEFCRLIMTTGGFVRLRRFSLGAICRPAWHGVIKLVIRLIEQMPALESFSICGSEKYALMESGMELLSALIGHSSLKHLDMKHNRIGNQGMFEAAKLVKQSQGLERIEIDGNKLTDPDALEEYLLACSKNPRLVDVVLPQLDISEIVQSFPQTAPVLRQKVAAVQQNILMNRINRAMSQPDEIPDVVFPCDPILQSLLKSGYQDLPTVLLSKCLHAWALCRHLSLPYPFSPEAMPTESGPMPLHTKEAEAGHEETEERRERASVTLSDSMIPPPHETEPESQHPLPDPYFPTLDNVIAPPPVYDTEPETEEPFSPDMDAPILQHVRKDPVLYCLSGDFSREWVRKLSNGSSDSFMDLEIMDTVTRSSIPDSILDDL